HRFSAPLESYRARAPVLNFRDAALKLTLVVGAVEMAPRFRDKSVATDRPHFVTTDTHRLPSAPRTGVRAGQRPVVYRAIALRLDVVHQHLQVWKRRHERLRSHSDGFTALRGSVGIDG